MSCHSERQSIEETLEEEDEEDEADGFSINLNLEENDGRVFSLLQ
jgi:hypothetical protein